VTLLGYELGMLHSCVRGGGKRRPQRPAEPRRGTGRFSRAFIGAIALVAIVHLYYFV